MVSRKPTIGVVGKEANVANVTVTLPYTTCWNAIRDVTRCVESWPLIIHDCSGMKFVVQLGETGGLHTTGHPPLDTLLYKDVQALIETRTQIAGDYVSVVDLSSFGMEVSTEEAEAFCRRLEAHYTVIEGDDVYIGACPPTKGQTPGMYKHTEGGMIFLKEPPEEIQRIFDDAYEYAMDTWPQVRKNAAGDCNMCGNICDVAPGRQWTCRDCGVTYRG